MNLHTSAPALTDGQVYAVTRASARRRLCHQPFMFQSPFRLLLVGQPGAGKTNATACIVNNGYVCHRPSFIYLVRRHHQDIYDRMLQHDNFEVLDNFEDFDLDTAPDGWLLIIDDMGFQMAESRAFSDLLSSSGHRGLSIICLVPFLFDLGSKCASQRNLYSHIACFKSPFRQTETFMNKLYTEDDDVMDFLYDQCQRTPRSLLLFDMRQDRTQHQPLVQLHSFELFWTIPIGTGNFKIILKKPV